jgi:hypothetical protein
LTKKLENSERFMNALSSAYAPLGGLPALLENLQRQVIDVMTRRSEIALYRPESPLKLVVGAAQSLFGVDLKVPGQVDDGKQQVAELVFSCRDIANAGGLFDFLKFFADLVMDTRAIGPVETRPGGPLAEFLRPFQRR